MTFQRNREREFYYIEEGSHCEGERMWGGGFLYMEMKRACFWKKVRTVLTGQMEKVRIFPFSEKEGGGAADSIPGHIVWRCHGNRVHIIQRRAVWIGGSVFNSPSGRMVRLNEDGAVSRTPFWYECLFFKSGCVWKWAPWFWVWGREGTVREVRKARQRLVWRCHSDRCASLGAVCSYLDFVPLC